VEETPASTTSDVFLALAIGLAATAFAAYARHISLARPGVTTHLGFYRGFDQGSYLRTARWLGAIAGSLIGSLFYLSFVAGGAGDLAFGNARSWAPWYPLWALCSVLGLAASLSWLSKLAAPWQRSHVTSE
jgi:hypothetical protein